MVNGICPRMLLLPSKRALPLHARLSSGAKGSPLEDGYGPTFGFDSARGSSKRYPMSSFSFP